VLLTLGPCSSQLRYSRLQDTCLCPAGLELLRRNRHFTLAGPTMGLNRVPLTIEVIRKCLQETSRSMLRRQSASCSSSTEAPLSPP
jgi:hypothetical protein